MTFNHHYTLFVEIWSYFEANCAELTVAGPITVSGHGTLRICCLTI